jgi:uncharacterized Rmd1/YagE family protein
MIDDVIYTPYVYVPPIGLSESLRSHAEHKAQTPGSATGDLLGASYLIAQDSLDTTASPRKHRRNDIFTESPTEAEIFIFEYGTVVIWGMTEAEEKRFLSSLFVHPFKKFDVCRTYPPIH